MTVHHDDATFMYALVMTEDKFPTESFSVWIEDNCAGDVQAYASIGQIGFWFEKEQDAVAFSVRYL